MHLPKPANPTSVESAERKRSRAERPPAEAPMATMVKFFSNLENQILS